jgi:hypothetical protein
MIHVIITLYSYIIYFGELIFTLKYDSKSHVTILTETHFSENRFNYYDENEKLMPVPVMPHRVTSAVQECKG